MTNRLVLVVLLLGVSLAGRVPGWIPGVHYDRPESHNRAFRGRGLDERDIIPVVCNESEAIIEGIPVTFTNGSCHDLEDVNKGASLMEHERLLLNTFIDKRSQQDGRNRPSPREISNRVSFLPPGLPPNIKGASALVIMCGQLIDHDIALVLEQEEPPELEEGEEKVPLEFYPEMISVEIPPDDLQFDPMEPMVFTRSEFCTNERFEREFEVELTPWLDAGFVYGDTQNRTDLLREFTGGLMRVSIFDGQEFPPQNETSGLFLCGDIRCEENTMLFSWHTIFLRNHNFHARAYAQQSGITDDETLFQNARIRVIAEYQQIVWDQYFPYLLGRNTFFQLTGNYRLDEDEDPVTSLIFTSAVFRYGHSGVPNDFIFLNSQLQETRPTVALAESFNNVEPVLNNAEAIGEIFVGQGSRPHDILDTRVVSGIRDSLFANIEEFAPGFDLIARNIARARDHGVATFPFYRAAAGLDPYECDDDPRDCFNQLTSDQEIAEALFELYGSIEECEMWICGMAEDNFRDSLLGETFTVLMAEQFNRIRNADRIWYDNIQAQLENAEFDPVSFPFTLVDLVERTTEIDVPFDNLFMTRPVWLAFTAETEWQVEWYLPPRLRGSIQSYEIDANGETYVVETNELLFVLEDNARPGTNYEVTVTALLQGDENEVLGTVNFRTDGFRLQTGAIVGIVIGSVVGAVGIGAGVVYFVRRRRRSKFGQDTFLQL